MNRRPSNFKMVQIKTLTLQLISHTGQKTLCFKNDKGYPQSIPLQNNFWKTDSMRPRCIFKKYRIRTI